MTLLDDPPERYFIIVNSVWPTTRTALESTGRFASAAFEAMKGDSSIASAFAAGTLDYLPYIENPSWLGRWSVPGRTVALRYRVDHDAELVRRQHFPRSPSRFSAVFAFGDGESCERVEAALEWERKDRREFRLLPDPCNRVVRLNFHAYTAARERYLTELDFRCEEREELWMPYWTGGPPPLDPLPARFREPLWEYLIEGVLETVAL
jgi:hypothetical protein